MLFAAAAPARGMNATATAMGCAGKGNGVRRQAERASIGVSQLLQHLVADVYLRTSEDYAAVARAVEDELIAA